MELFPEEALETYYIPPVRKAVSRDNKPGVAKGKLHDKYHYMCTFINRGKKLLDAAKMKAIVPQTNEGEVI